MQLYLKIFLILLEFSIMRWWPILLLIDVAISLHRVWLQEPYFTYAINGKLLAFCFIGDELFLSHPDTSLSLVKSGGLRDVVRKCKRFVEHNRLSEGSLTRFHNPWSQWRKNGYSPVYYRSTTLQQRPIAGCIISVGPRFMHETYVKGPPLCWLYLVNAIFFVKIE